MRGWDEGGASCTGGQDKVQSCLSAETHHPNRSHPTVAKQHYSSLFPPKPTPGIRALCQLIYDGPQRGARCVGGVEEHVPLLRSVHLDGCALLGTVAGVEARQHALVLGG